MNILHLLSQTHLTGAEVYVRDLIIAQEKNHRCFIVSDTLNIKTNASYTAMNIDKRSLIMRFNWLFKLLRFCWRNNIDIIHSHSRASSYLAHYVTKFLNIAHVATVHGRQGSGRYFSHRYGNVYGKAIVVICEALKTHLTVDLAMDKKRICVIRNAFNLPLPQAKTNNSLPQNNTWRIAWVGRLTGPKGKVLQNLMTQVFKHLPDVHFDCFGGPDEHIATWQKIAPNNCCLFGQQSNVLTRLQDYDLVIGAGRVALEAMFLNKNVYAIGEAQAIGIIDKKNIALAKQSNFGDCAEDKQNIDYQMVRKQLSAWLQAPTLPDYQNILDEYQLEAVAAQIMALYEQQIKQ